MERQGLLCWVPEQIQVTLVHISAKLPELTLLDTTRISNGTNFPRLALLYRQNFLRVW